MALGLVPSQGRSEQPALASPFLVMLFPAHRTRLSLRPYNPENLEVERP